MESSDQRPTLPLSRNALETSSFQTFPPLIHSFDGNIAILVVLSLRMVQGLGATLNVMVLLLVNMIGYAVGIKGAGRVAGGIFVDWEGLLAVAYSFMFVFSGVQASACHCCVS